MSPDPIVEEVRAERDEIAKEHNYDINSIFEMLRELDATSPSRHVTLSPRRITATEQHDANLEKGAA